MTYLCAGMAGVAAQFVGWRDGRCAASVTRRRAMRVEKTGAPWIALLGLQSDHSCLIRAASVSQTGNEGDGRDRSVTVAVPPQIGNGSVDLPMSVDAISSPNNAYVKHLVKLRQNSKTRNANASVLVVGTVPLTEICESVEIERRFTPLIDMLLVREDVQTPEGLAGLSRRVVRVSRAAMSKVSGLDSPPEAVGILGFPSTFTVFEPHHRDAATGATSAGIQMQKWCVSPRRILVLDSIQDPGNMGTLLRTAVAFAWDGVFLLNGCCDPFNDKVLRAARGASFRVPIAIGEWHHVRDFAVVHKLKLYAGDPEPPDAASDRMQFGPGGNLSQVNMEELKLSVHDGEAGLCLVLGSEGQGLSDGVRRDCSPIGIPMRGNFESLNVAVAGGILMFLLS